jgi:glucosamine 6-phosphate synthetase-like amidotransferase/phosphosugar isomerase protein
MCGIAGFTIAPGVALERTALARLLLAGIAERGTDATGYGYHAADGAVQVHKESLRLREFVEHVAVPEGAGEAIFHVRGYTKGVPSVNDNNHPVRYGRTVVVHNGHLDNDDALFRRYRAAAIDYGGIYGAYRSVYRDFAKARDFEEFIRRLPEGEESAAEEAE